jgi:GABA(A) receptor-associated protein
MTKFSDKPLERRQKEYKKIMDSYPDRIPVIVENAKDSQVPDLGKQKFALHSQHKAEDGFLYVTYSGESTFGSC